MKLSQLNSRSFVIYHLLILITLILFPFSQSFGQTCTKGNCVDGKGVMQFETGDRYFGEFKNGKQNGNGTYMFKSGTKYIGEWKDNKQHGTGTEINTNGVDFVGEWVKGSPHRGTITYPEGDIYEGEIKKRKMFGQGTFHYSSGDEYQGEFKNSLKDGYGVYNWVSGGKYEGEWKENKQHGRGIYEPTTGKKIEGIWEEGKLVSSDAQDEEDKSSDYTLLEEDALKYNEYYKKVKPIYDEFTSIISINSDIIDLITSFSNGEITFDYADKKIIPLVAKLKFASVSLKKATNKISLPDFSSANIKKRVEAFDNFIRSISSLASEELKIANKLYSAMKSNNFESLVELDIRSRNSYILALESENHFLNLSNIEGKESHPQYELTKSMIHVNNSMANLIKARISEYGSEAPQGSIEYLAGDPAAFIKIAERETKLAKNSIERGNKNVDEYKIELENYLKDTKSLIAESFIDSYDTLINSYIESFNIEDRIVKVLQAMINEYPTFENLTTFDLLFSKLIDERMEISERRIAMLPQFIKELSKLSKK